MGKQLRSPGRKSFASGELTEYLGLVYLMVLSRVEREKRWTIRESMDWLGVREQQRMRWYFDGLVNWGLLEGVGRYKTTGRPRVYEVTKEGMKWLKEWRARNRWWTDVSDRTLVVSEHTAFGED